MITLGILVSSKMSGVLFLSENRRTDIKGELAISATLKKLSLFNTKSKLEKIHSMDDSGAKRQCNYCYKNNECTRGVNHICLYITPPPSC